MRLLYLLKPALSCCCVDEWPPGERAQTLLAALPIVSRRAIAGRPRRLWVPLEKGIKLSPESAR